jgi:hypothetical protein
MYQKFVGLGAAVSLAVVVVGCGAGQSQFIKDFSVRFVDNDVTVSAEFSKAVPLNSELEVPIKNFGSIKLIPASADKGFQIQTTLNSSAWIDKELLNNKVSALPNGSSFPAFVTTDLALKNVSKGKQFSTNIYLGTVPAKKYLGAGIELQFLDSRFPSSLTLSQKILDANQREIGAVTLYGPLVKGGEVVAPGGLFFVTDVGLLKPAAQFASTAVTKRIPLMPYDGVDVRASNSTVEREYKKPSNLLKLLNLFNAQGREHGVID